MNPEAHVVRQVEKFEQVAQVGPHGKHNPPELKNPGLQVPQMVAEEHD